eukprot:gene12683-12270_t
MAPALLLMLSLFPASALGHKAAELRRWESDRTCDGSKYSVLSTDQMDTCFPKSIPAPASIWVEQTNATVYTSYHFRALPQGVKDCKGVDMTRVGDFVVGVCTAGDFGNYSQMRVWVD